MAVNKFPSSSNTLYIGTPVSGGLTVGNGNIHMEPGNWQRINNDIEILPADDKPKWFNVNDMDHDIHMLQVEVEMLRSALEVKDKQIKHAQEDIRYLQDHMGLRPR